MLIPRDQLAALNQLRDGPAWRRLTSHLLTLGAGGLVCGLVLAVGQPFLRLVLLAEHSGCSFSSNGTTTNRTTRHIAPQLAHLPALTLPGGGAQPA